MAQTAHSSTGFPTARTGSARDRSHAAGGRKPNISPPTAAIAEGCVAVDDPEAPRDPEWLRSDKALAVQFVREVHAFAGRRGWIALALVAAGAITEGFGLVLLVPVLHAVSQQSLSDQKGVGPLISDFLGRISQFAGIDAVPFALVLLGVTLVARATILAARQVVVADLQIAYFTRRQAGVTALLANARWERIATVRHARITQILSSDLNRVGSAAIGLINLLVASVTILIIFAAAFALSPLVALLGAAASGLSLIASRRLFRTARQVGNEVTDWNLRLFDDVGQFLNAMKLAVSQNLQHRFVDDFRRGVAAAAEHELDLYRHESRVRLWQSVIVAVAAVGTALIGYMVLAVAIPTLIAVLVILSRLSGPADSLLSQATMTIRALPAYRQLLLLERELAPSAPSPAAQPGGPVRFGTINFRNCSYRHASASNGTTFGVRNVDLEIPQGGFVGITGASGAGKTTLIDLMVGLFTPQSGHIELGGRKVDLSAHADWRNGLAYVAQDPFLRAATIRENLLWFAPDSDEAAMNEALRIAGADDLVARLPHGLDSAVGERGSLVSGGERQRIALAGALLRRPRLLILDEATNAIDEATERDLLDRIDLLRPEMTVVMVAHRRSSLSKCDRIVLLNDGEILRIGSFCGMRDALVPGEPAQLGA